jgi:hypothetical protein
MTGRGGVQLLSSLGLLLAALFSLGCQITRVSGTGVGVTDVGQGVLILSWEYSDLERKTAACITEAVQDALPKLRIVGADEFRRTVFAYGAPHDSAGRAKYFETLVREPMIRERMDSLGIRYLVYLAEAQTDIGPEEGGLAVVSVGMGGAVILGASMRERKTQLVASVVNIQTARAVGAVTAVASGPQGVISPGLPVIPMIALTETCSCGALGEAVASFLQGKVPEETRSKKSFRADE